ncbi:hypothetical protein [Taibaiella chishuiensis]|nr:hypothetical protein [Taibaiella chishuiensis]
MIPRDQKYMYEWESRRSKGKWKHILLTAVIWGTLLPVIITSFYLARNGELSFGNLFQVIFDDEFLLTWLKYFGGAFLFALVMWHLAKRKYESLRNRQKSDGSNMAH